MSIKNARMRFQIGTCVSWWSKCLSSVFVSRIMHCLV